MTQPRRRNAPPPRGGRSRDERPPQSPPSFWSAADHGYRPGTPEDADLLRRFNAEPESPPFTTRVNGKEIVFPKYNGVNWWFPEYADGALNRTWLEGFISWFFTVVNTVQTLSLFIWPVLLVYEFGWSYALPSLLLTVPLGEHLEHHYGPNAGTAYSSLHALYVSFHVTGWYLTYRRSSEEDVFDPNRAVFLCAFVALLYTIGTAVARAEKAVGKTWLAAVIAYVHLGIWFSLAWSSAKSLTSFIVQ